MQLPLLADVTKEISASYGTLLKDAGIALRGLFIIDPAGNLQQANINNLGVGRDVDEALRLVKAYQFVAEHGEVCPAGWTPGAATMIPTTDGAVSYFEKQADSAPDDDFNAQLPALKSEAEVTAAIAGPGPVVLDFYASWCGKCRQIAPHVEALVAEHKNVRVFKVDTDALPEVAAKYNASVLPTFSFFKARASLRAGPSKLTRYSAAHQGGKPALPPLQGYKKGPLAEAFASLAK
jgi:peroxiredoxin (alkyl hydroperoxide reductase subunit C)